MPGSCVSATIATFSAALQRRRRCGPDKISGLGMFSVITTTLLLPLSEVGGRVRSLRGANSLTGRGVRIEFVKERLSFTGEDSPMANLMLSVMGTFAEFERALIHERQREGIALAKQRGVYKGRKKSLASPDVARLRERLANGISKAQAAREFGISRQTLYEYLRSVEAGC